MIRRAELADVDIIMQMGLRFAGSEYAPHLLADPACCRAFAESAVMSPQMAVFLADHQGVIIGMLGGMVYRHPMSGELTAVELSWWIEPEARGGRDALRLIRAFEAWAMDQRASVIQLIAPNTRVGHLYGKLGYSAVETTYQRRVICQSEHQSRSAA